MKKNKIEISSFEKLLLGIEPPDLPVNVSPPRKGTLCPQCGNALLQLECPDCEFINGEGGGCT